MTILPTVHFQGSRLDFIDIGRGKDGQILEHFKQKFPQLFQTFTPVDPVPFKPPQPRT